MQGHAAYCLLTRISCAYCAVYTYVVTFKDYKLVRLSKYIRFLFYFSDKKNENNQSTLNNVIPTIELAEFINYFYLSRALPIYKKHEINIGSIKLKD